MRITNWSLAEKPNWVNSVASRNQGPAGGHAGVCGCRVLSSHNCSLASPWVILIQHTVPASSSTEWQRAKIVPRYSYAERLIFSLQPIASAIDLQCSSRPTVVGAVERISASNSIRRSR